MRLCIRGSNMLLRIRRVFWCLFDMHRLLRPDGHGERREIVRRQSFAFGRTNIFVDHICIQRIRFVHFDSVASVVAVAVAAAAARPNGPIVLFVVGFNRFRTATEIRGREG